LLLYSSHLPLGVPNGLVINQASAAFQLRRSDILISVDTIHTVTLTHIAHCKCYNLEEFGSSVGLLKLPKPALGHMTTRSTLRDFGHGFTLPSLIHDLPGDGHRRGPAIPAAFATIFSKL
jgi:hypothetical protein